MLHLMKKEMARSSVRVRFSAIRAFYEFLRMRGIVTKNVLGEVSLPKLEKQLPRFLTTNQMDRLIGSPAAAPRAKQAPSWTAARDTAIIELFYSPNSPASTSRTLTSSAKPPASQEKAQRNASARSEHRHSKPFQDTANWPAFTVVPSSSTNPGAASARGPSVP